jgi:hypothetical protein
VVVGRRTIIAYPDSGGLAFDPPSRDTVVRVTAAVFVGY